MWIWPLRMYVGHAVQNFDFSGGPHDAIQFKCKGRFSGGPHDAIQFKCKGRFETHHVYSDLYSPLGRQQIMRHKAVIGRIISGFWNKLAVTLSAAVFPGK